MHDAVIAKKIMDDARRKARAGGNSASGIKSIALEIGEFAPVTAGELKETFETLSGWAVKVKTTLAEANCECGFKGRPKLLERGHDFCLYACPKCGAAPKLEKGDEIAIVEVGF